MCTLLWIVSVVMKREQAPRYSPGACSFIDPKMKNHGSPKVCPWFGRLMAGSLPVQTLAPDRRSKKITESEKIKGKAGKRIQHVFSMFLRENEDSSRAFSRMQAFSFQYHYEDCTIFLTLCTSLAINGAPICPDSSVGRAED